MRISKDALLQRRQVQYRPVESPLIKPELCDIPAHLCMNTPNRVGSNNKSRKVRAKDSSLTFQIYSGEASMG